MREVRVLRCPRCGSTDVACDERRSIVDISCMVCGGCGNEAFVDSWERDFDWVAVVRVPESATALPARVAPLAPGMGQHDTPTPSPPPPPQRGCAHCGGADAVAAYAASQVTRETTVIAESHLGVHIAVCACGQRHVTIFTERIDWVGGEDDQNWVAAAVDVEHV